MINCFCIVNDDVHYIVSINYWLIFFYVYDTLFGLLLYSNELILITVVNLFVIVWDMCQVVKTKSFCTTARYKQSDTYINVII